MHILAGGIVFFVSHKPRMHAILSEQMLIQFASGYSLIDFNSFPFRRDKLSFLIEHLNLSKKETAIQ